MAGVAVSRVLDKLDGVKKISNGWVARCPSHEDQVQSLQVSERTDQSVGLHCHSGCSKSSLLAAIGLQFSDLYAPKHEVKEVQATYDYRDLTGKLLYQAVRYFPKDFRQRRPDGNGGWTWNMLALKGKHVAYRLPDLKGHAVVVVVEGEKDADRLHSLGIPATCNIGGAKKWGTAETKSLVAAGVQRVVVIPDNDEAGHQHAAVVSASAKGHGLAYNVVELPDLPEHGDVSDWLTAGHTKDELQALIVGFSSGGGYIVPPGQDASPAEPPAPPQDVHALEHYLDVTEYHMTDLGAAEALRDRFGDRLRYDHQCEQWLVWDGHFWRPDLDDHAFRIANEHIRLLQRDAIHVPDYLKRKEYLDWAMAREKRAPTVAMMASASVLKPMAISGEQWDDQGWLLGCQNGVVDLRTGVLRDGDREDYITLQAGAAFDPTASCDRWWQFLHEIFDGDVELIDYIWRAVGYSLTADMREQCFFVMFGSGSNGKSIFIDALEKVFGTYGHRADMRMFAGRTDDTNAFQMADFRGKRLVLAAEVQPGSRMNEHVLKHYTGGETARGEYKYGRSFKFSPVGKIWLGVNHKPRVADDSFGFWRRVRLIPFLRTFTGSNEDRSLRDTLRSEASGILTWAVQGCLEWQQRGLVVPEVVRQATEDYQAAEDPLAEFFEDRTVVTPETITNQVPFPRLYGAYREWAKEQGISERYMLTAKSFQGFLASRPFERTKIGQTVVYKGFDLIKPALY